MASNHLHKDLRILRVRGLWISNLILERKARVPIKVYAVYVKAVKPVPIRNPKVGSGIAKSIDERTTIFLKRIDDRLKGEG